MPRWVLREFGIADRIISPAGWQRCKAPERRTHPWSRLVVGDVCADCNSGNAVKPVIPSLATGERAVTMLTDEENLSLARWAAKTTFLSQRTAGIPAVIPLDAFCSFRDRWRRGSDWFRAGEAGDE